MFVWSWSFHLWLRSLHPSSLDSGESEARGSFLPAFVRLWISSPRWDCRRRRRCHPSNQCVPALLIYSTAVTQHHSVRSSRMKNQTAGSFCETLEEIWFGCKGAWPDFYSCCQKFEPQTYWTSETLFYGDRRTTNVLQAAADCAFSAIQPLHLHPEWRDPCWLQHSKNNLRVSLTIPNYCIIMK